MQVRFVLDNFKLQEKKARLVRTRSDVFCVEADNLHVIFFVLGPDNYLYIADIVVASCERTLSCLTTSIPRPDRSLLIQAGLQQTHKRVPNATCLCQAKEATEE